LEQKSPEPFGVSEFLMVALYRPQQLAAFFRDNMAARDLT